MRAKTLPWSVLRRRRRLRTKTWVRVGRTRDGENSMPHVASWTNRFWTRNVPKKNKSRAFPPVKGLVLVLSVTVFWHSPRNARMSTAQIASAFACMLTRRAGAVIPLCGLNNMRPDQGFVQGSSAVVEALAAGMLRLFPLAVVCVCCRLFFGDVC